MSHLLEAFRKAAPLLLAGGLFPGPAMAETVHGRVTFVGTLTEEPRPDGTSSARFRFRLSESYCSNTVDGLWMKSWDGTSWSGWQQVAPQPLGSDPAAISRGPNLIDVFAVGTDGRMYQMTWNGTQWSSWTSVGTTETFSLAPAVVSSAAGLMNLFARGSDNALWMNRWTGTWSGWRRLSPAPIGSRPAAAVRSPGLVDVFARGTDGMVYTLSWNDGTGSATGWSVMGPETVSSGPAAVATAAGRTDLFVRGMDNRFYTRTRTGTGWSLVLPEPTVSDPAALSLATNSVELFARRADNQIYHASLVGNAVQLGWTALGTEGFQGGPAVASRGTNRIDVFARGGGRADRWFHVTSGRTDGAFPANFRNAYNTLLSGFLARTVANMQVDGVPDCGDAQVQTVPAERIQIGIHP